MPLPLSLVPVVAALAQPPEPAPDKSAYTLLNPTPREQMREMSTDRPDTTESPRTVDAGHFQVEMSFVEFEREDDGARVDSWTIAPVNFKVGVLNSLDVQLVFDPYLLEQERGQPEVSGVGDLAVRVKVNLVGNDEEGFALGVMPFVKFPTGGEEVSNGALEGGIIVPAGFDLPGGWGLGLMLELDAVRNDQGGYDAALVHTATIGSDLWGDLGGFVEYAGTAISGADYEAVFNAGLTYGISPDVVLDAGIGIGLTEAAPDLRVWAGMSFRY